MYVVLRMPIRPGNMITDRWVVRPGNMIAMVWLKRLVLTTQSFHTRDLMSDIIIANNDLTCDVWVDWSVEIYGTIWSTITNYHRKINCGHNTRLHGHVISHQYPKLLLKIDMHFVPTFGVKWNDSIFTDRLYRKYDTLPGCSDAAAFCLIHSMMFNKTSWFLMPSHNNHGALHVSRTKTYLSGPMPMQLNSACIQL